MNPQNLGFRAQVRFLGSTEGGRRRPAVSGHYGPQLQLGSVASSVLVVRMEGDQVAVEEDLAPGETYDVFIVAQFAGYYPSEAVDLRRVELCEGPRIVAVGEVTGPVFESAPPSVLSKIRSAR